MVRLSLLLALLAGPAAAGCFGPPFPKAVHFEGGRTVETLSHTALDLTYRSLLPDGSPTVVTMRNGLFVLAASSHGATYSYEWVTPLPELSALVPGFQGSFEADMSVEHASRSFFQSDIEVLRADVFHLSGCDYPVLVVKRTDTQDGAVLGAITMWLSTTLRFALRTEVTVAGATVIHEVVSMDAP